MAINDISQYFTLDNGTQIANDNTFASLAANTRIKNKNSGSTFIKNSNYSNVFDRVSTFTEFIKATDFNIKSSGSGNGVASISYTPSTRTVTQTLTAFATPAELTTASNNLKSQAVGSISVSGRTVTYKNINGQTLGSFQTQDNDTTYSAGTGLYLSGTQFNVRIPNDRNEFGNNNNYLMVLNTAQNKCVPVDININRIFEYVNQKIASSAPSYGSERIVYTLHTNISSGQLVSGDILYGNPGDGGSGPSARLSGTWKITSGLSYHHTHSWTVTSSGGNCGQGGGSQTYSEAVYQCYAKQFLG